MLRFDLGFVLLTYFLLISKTTKQVADYTYR